jgi:lauroyl/myristoyl acyltransferase
VSLQTGMVLVLPHLASLELVVLAVALESQLVLE